MVFVQFSSYSKAGCNDALPFIVQRNGEGVCLQDVLRVGSAAASYSGQCLPSGEVVRRSCDDINCMVNCANVTVANGTCIPFGSGNYIAQCLDELPSVAPLPVDPPLGGKGTVVGIALGTVFGGLIITLMLIYWRRQVRGSGGCVRPGGRRGHKQYIRDKRPTLKQMLPRMSFRARQSMMPGGVVDVLGGRASNASGASVERSALQEYEATIAAAAASAARASGEGVREPQRELSAGTPGASARASSHHSPGSGTGTSASPTSGGGATPGSSYAHIDRRLAVGLAASAPSGYFSVEQRPTLIAPGTPTQGEADGGAGERPVSTAGSGHLMPMTGVVGWGGPVASVAVTPFGSSNALPKASAFNGTGSVLSGGFAPSSSGATGAAGGTGSGSVSSSNNSIVNGLRPLSSRLAVLSQAFKPSAKGGERGSLRVGNIETRNPIPSISVHHTPSASPRLVVGPVLTQLSPRAMAMGSPASVLSSTHSSGGNGLGSISATTAAGTTTYVNPNAGGMQSGSAGASSAPSPVMGGGAAEGDEEGGSGPRSSVGRRGESASPSQAVATSASGAMWAAAGVSVSPHPGSATGSRGSTPSLSRVSSPPALTPSSSERRLSTLGEEDPN